MGIFSKLFGESEHKDNQPIAVKWNELTDLNQLEDLSSESFDKPVFIFKHSTRCAISRMALKNFETHYKPFADEEPYFLDLLEYRNVSNEIASRFDVVHQSPQLLLIKDSKCVYTVSHSDIDANDLTKKLNTLKS